MVLDGFYGPMGNYGQNISWDSFVSSKGLRTNECSNTASLGYPWGHLLDVHKWYCVQLDDKVQIETNNLQNFAICLPAPALTLFASSGFPDTFLLHTYTTRIYS